MGEITLEILRRGAAGKELGPEELNRFKVGTETERIIPTRYGGTRVFFYTPVEKKERYPIFINLHGGGFIKGHRDQDVVFCKNICQNSGYAVIDIDYHTAPEYKYPYAVNESYDVIKYVAEHPEEFQGDPDILVLAGHSAGGNLAAAVEFMALESGDFHPTQLILDYPPMNMDRDPEERRYAYAPYISNSVEQERKYLEWYIDKPYRRDITASPVFANKSELCGFPPTLMLLAEQDILSQDAEVFAYKLIDAGVTVYVKRVKGSSHGFTVRRKAGFEVAESMIFEVLQRQLLKEWKGERNP